MKQIDDNTVSFTGTAISILQIMDRMDECQGLVYETDIPRDEIIPEFIVDPIQRFIREKGCSFIMDASKYTVQFRKLS